MWSCEVDMHTSLEPEEKSLGIWLKIFGILQELAEFSSDHDMGTTQTTLRARVMQPAATSAKPGTLFRRAVLLVGSMKGAWLYEENINY